VWPDAIGDRRTGREDDSIEQLCRLMWEERVHRAPIVRDAVLVGIVTALDICKSVANGALAGR
jgi:CBS domain-containing protein